MKKLMEDSFVLTIFGSCSFYLQNWSSNSTDCMNAKSLILLAQIQIPIPNKNLGWGYKGLVFSRNNGWIIENMDKGLTVPKWMLIVHPKMTKMPQNLFAQFVWPSPKILDFNEKVSLGIRSPCPTAQFCGPARNFNN
jgi:hypothetical protein